MYNKNFSAVITVYNKREIIKRTVESLLKQPVKLEEIYIIDDGSNDGSIDVIKEIAAKHDNIKCIFLKRQGITAALNAGLTKVLGEFIIVLDGDVVLDEKWIDKLLPYFQDEKVAAVSGLTKLGNNKNIWPALAGYNVEYRQSKIKSPFINHLSTCNTIYRKSALEKVGLFSPALFYGQDNDLSYRMIDAGYKLILSKDTYCLHFWPENFGGFFKQRFHGAVARMRLFKKYPNRWQGDKISGLPYFLELPMGLFLIFSLLFSLISKLFLWFAVCIIFFCYLSEFNEIRFFLNKGKRVIGLFLPFFSLLRSLAWTSGIIFFYFHDRQPK